jgi:tRNA A-37 threonylcarbamoyl transferase component Bud32
MRKISEQVLRDSIEGLLPAGSSITLTDYEQIGNLGKPVYRLAFSDGSQAKMRLVSSPMRATEIAQLSEFFSEGDSAKILAVSQDALLEEWIEGDQLAEGGITQDTAVEAGQILGRLHSATRLGEPRSAQAALWRIEQNVRRLVSESFLASEDAEKLLNLVSEQAPTSCEYGISHRDLCGENLIIQKNGKLVLIDHESMRFGPLNQDVARTCHRWYLCGSNLRDFLSGYSLHRKLQSFEKNFFFWISLVVTTSIVWGLNSGKKDMKFLKSEMGMLLVLGEKYLSQTGNPLDYWHYAVEARKG